MTMDELGEPHADDADGFPEGVEIELVTTAVVKPLVIGADDGRYGGIAIRLGNEDGDQTPTFWMHWRAALELIEAVTGSARMAADAELDANGYAIEPDDDDESAT